MEDRAIRSGARSIPIWKNGERVIAETMARAEIPGLPVSLSHAAPGSGIILEHVFSPQATPVRITHVRGSGSPLGVNRDKPASQHLPGGKISQSGRMAAQKVARIRVNSLNGVTDSTVTFAV